MQYNFVWDPNKALANVRKHRVTFRQATDVFRDPRHLSIYDVEHSDEEDRWITLGIAGEGLLLVVIHTFKQSSNETINIRIISARRATTGEMLHYQEANS